MKFFIAHKVTGENRNDLEKTMKIIHSGLKAAGRTYYSTISEGESFLEKAKREMIEHSFKEIDNSEALFVFINSENKSEGVLMKVGYCLAKNKKIVLAIKKEVTNTYLRDIADQVIGFDHIEDLNEGIKEIK